MTDRMDRRVRVEGLIIGIMIGLTVAVLLAAVIAPSALLNAALCLPVAALCGVEGFLHRSQYPDSAMTTSVQVRRVAVVLGLIFSAGLALWVHSIITPDHLRGPVVLVRVDEFLVYAGCLFWGLGPMLLAANWIGRAMGRRAECGPPS